VDAKELVLALRRRRESWVTLAEGKRVKIRRPPETGLREFLTIVDGKRTWLVGLEAVQRHVVDWDGFTEADILGASVGSSDTVPFDADLWSELVANNIEWLNDVAAALLKDIVDFLAAKDEVAKN
jgi:hypothetical protein